MRLSYFGHRLLALLLLGAVNQLKADQPNVVVLFADDAGYADFGFQESARADMAHLTPHIDNIAAAGARFTQAYVTGAVCSPSRAGLMTGRYQERYSADHR
jgi:arylsulfatase A-like enzyme